MGFPVPVPTSLVGIPRVEDYSNLRGVDVKNVFLQHFVPRSMQPDEFCAYPPLPIIAYISLPKTYKFWAHFSNKLQFISFVELTKASLAMFSKLAVVASILAVATATQTITAHPPPPTETTVPSCTTGLSSQFFDVP
ncbi:MAG TPA: hypothetical protein VGO47_13355 [Chlamydiales bacterium]|nr:hypothetical protein [Chlamydiales bacterium]